MDDGVEVDVFFFKENTAYVVRFSYWSSDVCSSDLLRLVAMKDRWSGTLVMIGQPSEELGLGAKRMLDDGLFTRFPKPGHVLALHDSASLPAGTIVYSPGYALANEFGSASCRERVCQYV